MVNKLFKLQLKITSSCRLVSSRKELIAWQPLIDSRMRKNGFRGGQVADQLLLALNYLFICNQCKYIIPTLCFIVLIMICHCFFACKSR